MKATFSSIINSTTPVLVDFYAEWCGPCKSQSPIIRDFAIEMGNKVRVIKIDVDKNPEIATRYKIQGVPTIMLFKEGKVLFSQAGMMMKSQLKNMVSSKI